MKHEEMVVKLFETIDAGKFDELSQYFDPEVVYERPGFPKISGISQMLEFYKNVRSIREGRHDVQHVVSGSANAMSYGQFEGTRKDGEHVEVGFAEIYGFNLEKIVFRRTYFYQPAV